MMPTAVSTERGTVRVILARPPWSIELWHQDARAAAVLLYQDAQRAEEAGANVSLKRLGLPAEHTLTPQQAKYFASTLFDVSAEADLRLDDMITIPVEADRPIQVRIAQ